MRLGIAANLIELNKLASVRGLATAPQRTHDGDVLLRATCAIVERNPECCELL